eukprot:m.146231 g.146231  ORF g.146231 m.146231 type:complete len:130 (-) comp16234_c0_seq2:35-424(-)
MSVSKGTRERLETLGSEVDAETRELVNMIASMNSGTVRLQKQRSGRIPTSMIDMVDSPPNSVVLAAEVPAWEDVLKLAVSLKANIDSTLTPALRVCSFFVLTPSFHASCSPSRPSAGMTLLSTQSFFIA